MITYVKLINYISFGEIEFDFHNNKTTAKNYAVIYGENGSGKTNFVKSFIWLINSLTSFNKEMLFNDISQSEKVNVKELMALIKGNNFFSETLFQSRMIDCEEPTVLEYGFNYKEHEGVYRVEFKDYIISESLKYWTGKQTGNLFELKIDENNKIITKLGTNTIINSKVKTEIELEIEKYWGKHTFLSIIYKQLKEQNSLFNTNSYSEYLIDVIDCFSKLNVITKEDRVSRIFISKGFNSILSKLNSGKVGKANKENIIKLKRSELVIDTILKQLYADIKKVEFEKRYDNESEQLTYKLFIYKMIAGKIRKIDVENESTGTNQVIRLLYPIFASMMGMTVIIDEADTGIHDLLFKKIIDSIKDDITGQLIITTHNTTILEDLEPKNAYIIDVDCEGNKEAICLNEYKIKRNNNPRIMYLKGQFGGIPYGEEFDAKLAISKINISDEDIEKLDDKFFNQIDSHEKKGNNIWQD